MKILLDECVTKKLKKFLSAHECFTVSQMKWNGLKNGKLMEKCAENDFDILLTIDKNFLSQQNLKKYNLTVIVFDSETSKIEELKKFIPAFEQQAVQFKKNNGYVIQK